MTEPSENPVNLEWTDHQNRSWTAGMWGVYALMPNEAILSVANKQGEGVQLGGHFPSVDEAKALAQRLQDVLSGTGEAECRTNRETIRQLREALIRIAGTPTKSSPEIAHIMASEALECLKTYGWHGERADSDASGPQNGSECLTDHKDLMWTYYSEVDGFRVLLHGAQHCPTCGRLLKPEGA